jgi:hypothetical protein
MPWTPCLLATAVVGLAMAGCASQPKEAEAEHITKRSCAEEAANPLHLTTMQKAPSRDPEVESLLSEQTSDPRLMYLNRQMYQTLHALDVELRREQDIAACERNSSDTQTLQAQSAPNSGAGSGVGAGGGFAAGAGSAGQSGGVGASGGGASSAGTGGGSAASAGAGSAAGSSGTVASTAAVTMPVPAASSDAAASRNTSSGPTAIAAVNAVATAPGNGAPGAGRTALIHKSSLPPSSGGGNGATAQKIVAGSDNDIVARRLRKAAEQETDPALKAKLWKEYAQYQQGNVVK